MFARILSILKYVIPRGLLSELGQWKYGGDSMRQAEEYMRRIKAHEVLPAFERAEAEQELLNALLEIHADALRYPVALVAWKDKLDSLTSGLAELYNERMNKVKFKLNRSFYGGQDVIFMRFYFDDVYNTGGTHADLTAPLITNTGSGTIYHKEEYEPQADTIYGFVDSLEKSVKYKHLPHVDPSTYRLNTHIFDLSEAETLRIRRLEAESENYLV